MGCQHQGAAGPQFLVLPAFDPCRVSLAMIMRLTRSSLREVLYQDYIRTAYSKGLSQRAVLARHALKNAAIPWSHTFGSRLRTWLAAQSWWKPSSVIRVWGCWQCRASPHAISRHPGVR